MRRIVALILAIVLIFSISLPTEAAKKKKRKKVIIGYEMVEVETYEREYLGQFYITHYCPCSRCCGPYGGKVTASGTTPTVNRTVGVNPRLISYGTKLQVGDIDTYVAEDTGGGIGWKHLDIFCSSHQEALNAGVGYYPVWKLTKVTKTIKKPIYGYKLKAKKKDWRVKANEKNS